MKNLIESSADVRQSPSWAKYMERIGWEAIKVDDAYVYVKRIKLFNRSIVKVQHPKGRINLNKIEDKIKKTSPLFLIVEPHSFGYDEKNYLKTGFKKSRWNVAPSATIKIDLSKSEKEIFGSFSENAKRNIKKAEKNNFEIKIIDLKKEKDLSSFEEYFNLLKKLKDQKGFYAPGYDESYKKMEAFKDNSILLFAYENKKAVAVVWLGYFDKTITYLQTGITDRGYSLLANYLLVWEGIRWGKKNKNLVFDFESIYDIRNPRENKNWIGFSDFKKRFHGEIAYYPQPFIKFYSKTFKALYSLTTLFQKKHRDIIYSKINNNIEFRKSYGKDAIVVNNIPQSGGELLSMWNKIFKDLVKNKDKFKDSLILGVGGGDVVRKIQENFPSARITAVELDPVMIEIAKNKFNTPEKNTKFIVADAKDFVENEKKKYDLIICDLYIGRYNPKFAREKSFMNQMGNLLNNNGKILFNVHYEKEKQNQFDEFYKMCSEMFADVSVAYKFPRNQVLLLGGFHFK